LSLENIALLAPPDLDHPVVERWYKLETIVENDDQRISSPERRK
jgi:hypothetical protein